MGCKKQVFRHNAESALPPAHRFGAAVDPRNSSLGSGTTRSRRAAGSAISCVY
jgi:hypothetical protein